MPPQHWSPPQAALPCSLLGTISARPTRSSAPSRIYAKEGWSQFRTSCLQPQKIVHPESITFAAVPFSSFPSVPLRKRRKGRLGRYLGFQRDMRQGREIQRVVEQTTTNTAEAQDLPVDVLGLLQIPPESYSCFCHPDGKTCVHAHVGVPLRKYLWRHLSQRQDSICIYLCMKNRERTVALYDIDVDLQASAAYTTRRTLHQRQCHENVIPQRNGTWADFFTKSQPCNLLKSEKFHLKINEI